MDIYSPNVSVLENNNENLVLAVDLKSMDTVSSTVPNITNYEIIDIIADDITLKNF